MKRTAPSPDRSLKFGRKLKTAKFSRQLLAEQLSTSSPIKSGSSRWKKKRLSSIDSMLLKFQSDKENLQIKRCQSENCFEKTSSHWFDENALWQNLLKRTLDERFERSRTFLDAHPMISSRMRSILFDWLIEVAEVYHLHRETYHLSIAFIDQYLSRTKDLAKQKFQLLGIASLFVAAKIEEIYPPRLEDFTYVTDNTCSEEEILQMELDLMNVLNWHINPVSSISWLLIYLQVQHDFHEKVFKRNPLKKRRFSSFNGPTNEILRISMQSDAQRSKEFLQLFSNAARLLDFSSLDRNFGQFSTNVLAAAALLVYQIDWPVEELTGLTIDDLFQCQQWLKPFAEILKEHPTKSTLKTPLNVPSDEMYSIQIHNVSIDLLDLVEAKRPIKSAHRPLTNLVNQISFLPEFHEENSFRFN